MIGQRPTCYSVPFVCRHLHEPDPESIEDDAPLTCDAFPNGIPDAIFFGGVDHTQPYKGDRGIRYEPDEPVSSDAEAPGEPT